jgi:ribonuclease T
MSRIVDRFRGFMPVVVDVETGGFNPQTDALLELAVCIIEMDDEGWTRPGEVLMRHVEPFEGANIEAAALEFNGIRPITRCARRLTKNVPCRSCSCRYARPCAPPAASAPSWSGTTPISTWRFSMPPLRAVATSAIPSIPFSCFDTATLGGLAYGQTVLARAVQAAGLDWDKSQAHSAAYDTERTATLFCNIVNRWRHLEENRGRIGLNPAFTGPY